MTTDSPCPCPNQFSCGAKLQVPQEFENACDAIPINFNPYTPPKTATTSPFLRHASLDALTERALQHPSGTAGISDVKSILGKPCQAFQLTADHYIADTDTVAKAGTWAVAMLTAQNGKPIWFHMDDIDFRNSFAELAEDTGSSFANARMWAVLQKLFPGATLAQCEDAVSRGGYLALSAEQRATNDSIIVRQGEIIKRLAKEVEFTRPIIEKVKQVRSAATFHDQYVREVEGLLEQAEANGY
jgi:hypothetical protein